MTQSMRSDVFSNAGSASIFFDDAFDTTRGDAAKIAAGV